MKFPRLSIALAAILMFALTLAILGQAPPAPQGGQGAGGQGAGGQGGGRGGRGGGGGGRGAGGGGGRGGGGAAAPAQPTPRWPDGHPRLGALPGEKGLWHGAFGITATDIPYQDWARGV